MGAFQEWEVVEQPELEGHSYLLIFADTPTTLVALGGYVDPWPEAGVQVVNHKVWRRVNGVWSTLTTTAFGTLGITYAGACHAKLGVKHIIMGRDDEGATVMYSSEDLINWTNISANLPAELQGVSDLTVYHDRLFVVTGIGPSIFHTSDLINWSTYTFALASNYRGVQFSIVFDTMYLLALEVPE